MFASLPNSHVEARTPGAMVSGGCDFGRGLGGQGGGPVTQLEPLQGETGDRLPSLPSASDAGCAGTLILTSRLRHHEE